MKGFFLFIFVFSIQVVVHAQQPDEQKIAKNQFIFVADTSTRKCVTGDFNERELTHKVKAFIVVANNANSAFPNRLQITFQITALIQFQNSNRPVSVPVQLTETAIARTDDANDIFKENGYALEVDFSTRTQWHMLPLETPETQRWPAVGALKVNFEKSTITRFFPGSSGCQGIEYAGEYHSLHTTQEALNTKDERT